jgi:hypothetical protein
MQTVITEYPILESGCGVSGAVKGVFDELYHNTLII